MNQLIYALAGMAALMVLSVTIYGSIHSNSERMFFNEVISQMTGVGEDILDEAVSRPFDENTIEENFNEIDFPLIESPSDLTPASDFSSPDCDATSLANCDDIDDFHNLSGTATVDSTEYDWKVTVAYVDPVNLESSPSQSYAKEITVEVKQKAIRVGSDRDEPLTIKLQRVATYRRITGSSS